MRPLPLVFCSVRANKGADSMYLAAVFAVGMDFSAAILRALNLKNGGSSACQVSSSILGFLPQGALQCKRKRRAPDSIASRAIS
jgi:hypothetical protein